MYLILVLLHINNLIIQNVSDTERLRKLEERKMNKLKKKEKHYDGLFKE